MTMVDYVPCPQFTRQVKQPVPGGRGETSSSPTVSLGMRCEKKGSTEELQPTDLPNTPNTFIRDSLRRSGHLLCHPLGWQGGGTVTFSVPFTRQTSADYELIGCGLGREKSLEELTDRYHFPFLFSKLNQSWIYCPVSGIK